MDRLTHRYLHGGYWASIFKVSACGENECKGEIIDRLAVYENADEQGLLLWSPCKAEETILRQREELSRIEMRVLENFIHSMPKTYRKRNSNWGIVQDILQRNTSTAGQTSCMEKCRELGIDPDGHTLERVKEDG